MRTQTEIQAEYDRLNDMVNKHLIADWRKGKLWHELAAAHNALSWVLNDDSATMTDGKTPLDIAKPSECIEWPNISS